MKKLSLSLVAMIAMAITAQAVNSVNIVGINTVTLEPGKYMIMSAPVYETNGDGTNTLLGVFGDSLVASVSYLTADRVLLYDTVSGTYQAFAQYTDGHFYKCNSLDEWNLSILGDDEPIDVGESFWVVHPGTEAALDVTLSGEVLGGPSDTQSVAIVTGYQMASYPYATATAVQDILSEAKGATAAVSYLSADRIITWDVATQTYQAYALYTDGTWYKCNDLDEWNLSIAATEEIGVGGGFWYVSKTGFTWDEGCPYSGAY